MERKKINLLLTICFFFPMLLAAENGTERKLLEIKKIIELTVEQEDSIRRWHRCYSMLVDSSLYKVNDPILSAQIKYDAAKLFHDQFMSVLSEEQMIRYIQVTSTPEIHAKTTAKMETLQEAEDYPEEELQKYYTAIFNYLMLEKVVYVRDKYKIGKQKNNIAQLKKFQPKILSEINSKEKLKRQGGLKGKNFQW